MKVRFVALAVALIVGAPLQAAAFRMLGAGTASCGTWTSWRAQQANHPDHYVFEQWALGFISGTAYEGAASLDPLSGLDAEAVWAWIDNYCRANPLEEVFDAAAAFIHAHPR
jgi:hypothetical protein